MSTISPWGEAQERWNGGLWMTIDQQRSTQSSAYFATSGGYEPNSGTLSRQICGENEEFVSKRQLMYTSPPKTKKALTTVIWGIFCCCKIWLNKSNLWNLRNYLRCIFDLHLHNLSRVILNKSRVRQAFCQIFILEYTPLLFRFGFANAKGVL